MARAKLTLSAKATPADPPEQAIESPAVIVESKRIDIPDGLRTTEIRLSKLPFPIASSIECLFGRFRVLDKVHGIQDETGKVWGVEIGATQILFSEIEAE